ncbi:MAG: polysaccharide deacetylase family protein [Clostridia bacterium]|nr:polysaccharide deacetylase family protein [Clostridia bacterium]
MNIKPLYPNLSRKAITFTMDDGNMTYDRRLIEILAPAGITGTFNLVSDRINDKNIEEYRTLYKGYEITNHVKMHPRVILPTEELDYSDEPFDINTADKTKIYKAASEGVYYVYMRTWWGVIATTEAYCRLVDEGHRELEEVFGKGSVKAFVWPYRRQEDEAIHEYLKEYGYSSVRRTGLEGFDIPENLMDWCYNAIHNNVLDRAREFEALPDDGRLKYFALGVHAIDFERDGKWADLETFAEKYGTRNADYFYATVGEIFDYATAFARLSVEDGAIVNPTDETLYAELDGRAVVIPPNTRLEV